MLRTLFSSSEVESPESFLLYGDLDADNPAVAPGLHGELAYFLLDGLCLESAPTCVSAFVLPKFSHNLPPAVSLILPL